MGKKRPDGDGLVRKRSIMKTSTTKSVRVGQSKTRAHILILMIIAAAIFAAL